MASPHAHARVALATCSGSTTGFYRAAVAAPQGTEGEGAGAGEADDLDLNDLHVVRHCMQGVRFITTDKDKSLPPQSGSPSLHVEAGEGE